MRNPRGTIGRDVNTPARTPVPPWPLPRVSQGASTPGAEGHPTPWVCEVSRGLITNRGVTAWVHGVEVGITRLTVGCVGEEPEAGEVGIRVVWGGESMEKQRGKGIQGAGEVWTGAGQWGHAMCLISKVLPVFSQVSVSVSQVMPASAEGRVVAVGGDHGSGSVCPWWQPPEPAWVCVPVGDHQRMQPNRMRSGASSLCAFVCIVYVCFCVCLLEVRVQTHLHPSARFGKS